MKKLRWLAILMIITILGITGFQGYWLRNNYEREEQNLEIKTNTAFRQTILKLQASKLKLDKFDIRFDSVFRPVPTSGKVMVEPRKWDKRDTTQLPGKEPVITVFNLLQEKMRAQNDSAKRTYIISSENHTVGGLYTDSLPPALRSKAVAGRIESMTISNDSLPPPDLIREINLNRNKNSGNVITIQYGTDKKKEGNTDSVSHWTARSRESSFTMEDRLARRPAEGTKKNPIIRFLYDVDSLYMGDSVTVKEVTEAYSKRLKDESISGLSFAVNRLDSTHADSQSPSEVTIGFSKSITYGLSLENKLAYILGELLLPILFSVFLVGITVVSFVLLYRNLLKQQRLAELKNQFISNITHELKTPIATVGVAIEALKNFNAIQDPQRTKEYLDISQNELQRLGLLVDKVLKLSMFEKKELELKKEQFDCRQLAEEVINSMKLQFEKYHAKVKLHTSGDNFVVEADKLHITSVIYNLLDNALKYSPENPEINVRLEAFPEYIQFSVSDNGIGIPPAYKEKIFDKFFRVPTGDTHNAKGYGLGLSYVSEVLKRHQGNVSVESELGKGSTFTARLPYA